VQQVDTERAATIQQLGTLMAQEDQLPMIPVDTLPNIAAWRTDKVAGVQDSDLTSPYGFFFNMNKWYAAS
jgi:hypothetical protein